MHCGVIRAGLSLLTGCKKLSHRRECHFGSDHIGAQRTAERETTFGNNSTPAKRIDYPVDIPKASFPEFVFSCLRQYGNEVCMIDGHCGKTHTFSDVETFSRKVSSGLIHRGLKPNETVCLISNNCSDVIIAFLGITGAHGCCTFANALATKDELEHQVVDSGAVYLIADQQCFEKAFLVRKKLHDQVRDIFVLGSDGPSSIRELSGNHEDVSNSVLESIDSVNTPAIMLYSSGTTGVPKGVVHTHRTLTAGTCALSEIPYLGLDKNAVMLCVLPLCYMLAFEMVFSALRHGSKVVFLPRFYYETFCELIETYKITFLPAVPTIVEIMLEKEIPPFRDISSLATLLISGDSLYAQRVNKLMKKYKSIQQVFDVYGTTETSLVFSALLNEDGTRQSYLKPSCVQVKILTSTTEESARPFTRGELLVKSPFLMQTYKNRPEETQEVFTADGWIRTGDIVHLYEDGQLIFSGREKNMIKYKGHQVSPAELESILLTHESVLSAVVIGIPDSKCGELPRAYVILIPGSLHVTEGEVAEFVAAKTAPYKHLRGGVEFVDEFPISGRGKISRKTLREEYVNRKFPNIKNSIAYKKYHVMK